MNVLFSMRHLGSFRMYEPVVRALAQRGHAVHIVVDRAQGLGWQAVLDRLSAEHPSVRWSWAARYQSDLLWFEFSRIVRIWLDYLRFFEPHYDAAPVLRGRAADMVPARVLRLNHRWPLRTPRGRRVLAAMLRAVERAIPRMREIDRALAAEMPDVVLLTPLIYLGSPQVEMLRSAKALGLRTGLCVGSWDHLSSKALIREVPQRVFVWNHVQKDEAVTLHHVPEDCVVVTGAQCYDQWFGRSPSRSREQFCAQAGLPADRPFVLYVCSALIKGSPAEAPFVLSWLESLRRSKLEALRSIGVLIRPHPTRTLEWEGIDLGRFERVSLFGDNPVDTSSRNDYFDSLYYSAAVVGLNTSAFLEAAIVGRPVHAILPPEYSDNQEGTLHFHYLSTVAGGLLRTAKDVDTHHAQLAQSLSSGADNRRFVEAFIRPCGLDRAATEVFADAVERLGGEPRPLPERLGAAEIALRPLLFPAAFAARALFAGDADGADRTSREIARERQRQRRERNRVAKAQRQLAERQRLEQERERQKAALLRERSVAREQQLRERERAITESRREKVLRQKRREREKAAHHRRKRLAALRHRFMQKLGLA